MGHSAEFVIWSGIEHLFDHQPDLPKLILQASALAAAEPGKQLNGVVTGEITYINNTVLQAQKVIAEILVDKARVDVKLAPAIARNVIKTCFERAFLRAVL